MKKSLKQLVVVILILHITGCGLKGSLELPEQQQQTMQPA
ncbi:MAG: lipoprotein [Gammaproteobacteria bacterium]|nr:lipoprotein [Gammaproteobacteria bacterium]MCF6230610.1 lipoprotein [Gammaproteobacteria bacterium]